MGYGDCVYNYQCSSGYTCSGGTCRSSYSSSSDYYENTYAKWYWIGVLISLAVAAVISTLVYFFVIRPRRMRSAGAIRNAPLNPQANVVYMNPGQPQGYVVPAPMPTGMPGPQQVNSPVAPPPYTTTQQAV